MATQPFQWVDNKAVSPEQVAYARRMADSLGASRSKVAANGWEGLAQIANALSERAWRDEASRMEEEGHRSVAELLAGLTPESGFSDISAVMANPWATASQSAVAQALMGNQFNRANIADERAYQAGLLADQRAYDQPMRDLELEGAGLSNQAAQAQLDALLNPPVDPWAGTQVVNDQVIGMGEAGPQVLGDFRTQDQYRQLTPDEITLRGLDPTKSWQIGPDNRVYEVGNSGVNVTTNVGGEGDPYQKKFWESMAAADAKSFTDAIETGDAARRNRINLDRLSQLSATTPQGLAGSVINTLGEFGIKTDGLDKVQAMESLISQLVPTQRPPGSGTISDADLRLYKASLPRLINTPEGNQLILETMYAINDHDIAAAEIAQRVAAGELSPAEARQEMRALPNPFDNWNEKISQVEGPQVDDAPGQSQINPAIFGGAADDPLGLR